MNSAYSPNDSYSRKIRGRIYFYKTSGYRSLFNTSFKIFNLGQNHVLALDLAELDGK